MLGLYKPDVGIFATREVRIVWCVPRVYQAYKLESARGNYYWRLCVCRVYSTDFFQLSESNNDWKLLFPRMYKLWFYLCISAESYLSVDLFVFDMLFVEDGDRWRGKHDLCRRVLSVHQVAELVCIVSEFVRTV